jgi:signal transduction histidine kinase
MAQSLGEWQSTDSERLFMALAEELKLPLQQIARQAELGITQNTVASLFAIQTSADMTLQLLDSYLLGLRLASEPEERFEVEPVSVSAVLLDAKTQLASTAKQYNVELDLHINGRYEPVMAHRYALKAALVNLGYALIEALPAMGTRQLRLQLAAHRTKYGVVAGVYCDAEDLTPQVFRRAQNLYGNARQPLVAVSPNSGAGIFVAEAILQAMSSRLRTGRFQKLPGFAVTLPPSQQLALI